MSRQPAGRSGTRLALFIITLMAVLGSVSVKAEDGYLPSPAASKIVTAAPDGAPRAGVVILTQAQPQGQPDPHEQKTFGVLYTFSPRTIFVFRDEPTSFSFWNLQSDETHDFMLSTASGQVLMKMMLPQLKKTTVTLTFHKEGLYTFYCTMHQPEMTGQIYVLAPSHP